MRKKILQLLGLCILFAVFLHPRSVFAQESIQNFDVTLTAHKDGSMLFFMSKMMSSQGAQSVNYQQHMQQYQNKTPPGQ